MKYPTLHKWHVWLGWLVGVPLILWTLSGLFMVLTPIEEVRGEHLRAELAPLPAGLAAVPPKMEVRAVKSLSLENQPSGPVWIISYVDGGKRRADAATGALLPPVGAIAARELAQGYYAGEASIAGVRRFAAADAPLDFRTARPSWQVSLSDNTRLYIDADTGQLAAVRTSRWRLFDFMWGLHIMDLQSRENSSHWVLILFAAISLLALFLAFAMQIWRQRRRKRSPSNG